MDGRTNSRLTSKRINEKTSFGSFFSWNKTIARKAEGVKFDKKRGG